MTKNIYTVDIEDVVEYLQEHLFIGEEGNFTLDHDFNINDLYNIKGYIIPYHEVANDKG